MRLNYLFVRKTYEKRFCAIALERTAEITETAEGVETRLYAAVYINIILRLLSYLCVAYSKGFSATELLRASSVYCNA